jgi:hypothetical protein
MLGYRDNADVIVHVYASNADGKHNISFNILFRFGRA